MTKRRKLTIVKTSSHKLGKQLTRQQKERVVGGLCWSMSGGDCDTDIGPCETNFYSCSGSGC